MNFKPWTWVMLRAETRGILIRLISCASILVLSSASYADRRDNFEFTLIVPFVMSEEVEFDGGASIDINDDPGFGFGMGYHYTDNFALRGDVTWNSVSYDATRVLDDGNGTEERYSGKLDIFALSFGGDYYFTTGTLSPFVNGNVGWTNIDTNITDGGGDTVCWWDPWWGYVCDTILTTYQEDYWHYGVGAGLRLDLNRSTFLRLG